MTVFEREGGKLASSYLFLAASAVTCVGLIIFCSFDSCLVYFPREICLCQETFHFSATALITVQGKMQQDSSSGLGASCSSALLSSQWLISPRCLDDTCANKLNCLVLDLGTNSLQQSLMWILLMTVSTLPNNLRSCSGSLGVK